MEGIGFLIFISFAFTFGPPVLFFIAGIARHQKNRSSAMLFYIVGTVWLLIGGGICATIMFG